MLLPSKVTSYKESDLHIAFLLAQYLRGKKTKPLALIQKLKTDDKCRNIDLATLIYALKILYALRAIEFENEEITYVG